MSHPIPVSAGMGVPGPCFALGRAQGRPAAPRGAFLGRNVVTAPHASARVAVASGTVCRSSQAPGRDGAKRMPPSPGNGEMVQTTAMKEKRKKLAGALMLELAATREQTAERIANWDEERLMREGYTLINLTASQEGTLFKDTVVQFTLPAGKTLPSQSFTQGDLVVVSPYPSGAIPDLPLEGTVMVKGWNFVRLAMNETTADRVLAMITSWRLDRGVNKTVFQRGVDAVEKLTAPIPTKLPPVDAVRKIVLCDSFSARLAVSPWAKLQWRERAFSELAMVGLDLNDSQHHAIATALSRRLTLWQGPPGTGKTRTLLRFIDVCRRSGLNGQVLACSDSNIAADNILEGLLEMGIKVVRIGMPVKVKEELRAATVEGQLEQHPWGRQSIERRDAALRLRDQAALEESRKMTGLAMQMRAEASGLLKEAREYEDAARADILKSADVVVGTCVGVGDRSLEGRTFSVVVIDEATQATEPATLIPLMKGAMCVVMAGDPMQLPPTVISQKAAQLGLGVSLFEQLQTAGGVEAELLDTQYRMHPIIAQFSSDMFYQGRVKSATTEADRPAPAGFPWPVPSAPVCFITTRSAESGKDQAGGSVSNTGEARMAVAVVQKMVEVGEIDQKDIVLLTPYQRQLKVLSGMLSRAGLEQVDCKTVDGYQGRESEVVVFSTVRSNPRKSLGFVSDVRRLNVAFTRARRGLVVLGNPNTLESSAEWSVWMEWMQARGAVVSEEQCRADILALTSEGANSGLTARRREMLWADDTEINGPTDHAAAGGGLAGGGQDGTSGVRGSSANVPHQRPSPDERKLKSLTLKDLKAAGKVFQVRGYSRMKKSELVAALFNKGVRLGDVKKLLAGKEAGASAAGGGEQEVGGEAEQAEGEQAEGGGGEAAVEGGEQGEGGGMEEGTSVVKETA